MCRIEQAQATEAKPLCCRCLVAARAPPVGFPYAFLQGEYFLSRRSWISCGRLTLVDVHALVALWLGLPPHFLFLFPPPSSHLYSPVSVVPSSLHPPSHPHSQIRRSVLKAHPASLLRVSLCVLLHVSMASPRPPVKVAIAWAFLRKSKLSMYVACSAVRWSRFPASRLPEVPFAAFCP